MNLLQIVPDVLANALAGPLPGLNAQLRMAPSYRTDPSQVSVVDKDCRVGGVLVLLYPRDGLLHVLLTVRTHVLRNHSGQVSFPGGGCEPGESPREAALREAQEECGVEPASIRLLGGLTPLYIPPSNFCIYPQVGFSATPPDLRPHTDEVAALLEVPLPFLAAPGTRQAEFWELRGQQVRVPFFAIGAHKVWGATAMVLSELLTILGRLGLSQEPQPS
ncbi:MAG: CoA pyrophosphatase [Ardenticatenaceae bacterium]|nr:CoA pyrophosphatase [Ardenticatenaceae bacterium]HBY98031.1 CoA pyrophosphatase [Chloroflexota bacterium]